MSAPSDTNKKAPSAGDYMIPASSGWAGAWKICAGIGILGLGGAAAGWAMDPKRFAFAYLFAFIAGLTLAFGSMFFVLVDRLTKAGWSVTVRRTAEFFTWGVWVFALLFIPVLLSMGTLYPWLHPGEGSVESEARAAQTAPPPEPAGAVPPGHPPLAQPRPLVPRGPHAMPGAPGHPDLQRPNFNHPDERGTHQAMPGSDPGETAEAEVLARKRPWLNKVGWVVRAFIYFAAWIWIGLTFFRFSTSQDGTKNPKLTVKAESLAPIATFVFGLTLTGAAFDWLMSLLPTWYSTIYGVTIFAGSVVCMYATMILVTMSLRSAGHLKNAVNVEHFHDLGKLLFGFLIFWAYVSFAQFMLIWYAAIPEETDFFHHRWDVGPWMAISLGIVVLKFVVPFLLLLSRNVKRRLWALQIGAVWLIAMHVLEMYWQVMPYFGGGETDGAYWIEAVCLLGVAGTYLAVVFYRMTKHPLIPVGDPRLSRALMFENA